MRFHSGILILIALVSFALIFPLACDDDDDDSGGVPADDGTGDDDNDDSTDDDDDDDDISDDDDDDDDTQETFPPDEQEPLYEKGDILPPNVLECTPIDTGIPQTDCNNHGSALAELPDGTIAAVWYHGVAEKSPDSRIVWSKLPLGTADWTFPEVLYDDPTRSEGNPALWVHEDGTLMVFFVTIFGDSWPESKIRMITSDDLGQTWSADTILRNKYCWMTRHRPFRMPNGDLLLPCYSECLAYPVYIRSTDDFQTWSEENHLSLEYFIGHLGQIQPALTVLPDGTVTAVTRDGFPSNRVKRTVSTDSGATWSPSWPVRLPNSGTSIDQVTLLDGHVVVVFNNAPDARFPLSVALSHDGGETYVNIGNINAECEGSCSYSYPSILQSTKDGTIWVTYSRNRDTISWVHFNERWLMDQNEEPNLRFGF